ncbi:MerR family transcriptional regulator [Phytomonospora endophytica]|uniref:DNA-binding transcriptional MerR regulator n=1 Tax=Phytomonospora endophytica TaxID=714109 RepID=A0A841FMQ8_9ACTN|nr:MerR family transcriptional regulator [Phytomonospora endophytica]MBB6038591.1 DNA-binding transcriptional MerR regulator [Phytomonospora endophytica]GIG69266.1 transcriptional regulator [Phytomonospora endophytica]
MKDGLSPKEVAQRLGIAVSTLRTWHTRYGLGPGEHTSGSHRRYGHNDLARLEVMRDLTARGFHAATAARIAVTVGAPHDERPGTEAPETIRRSVRGLAKAANRLDVLAMRVLIDDHVSAYGVIDTWDHLLRPVLGGIGDRHATTGRFVEVEHLLSRCVSEVLGSVPRPRPGARLSVMLACAAGETHSLPLEALAAALAERDVGCWLLGSRVPTDALLDATERTGPDLVVMWSHDADTADAEPLTALSSRVPVVAIAGPGWGDRPDPGWTFLASLREAVELATRLGA